jgi:hypothetical protein
MDLGEPSLKELFNRTKTQQDDLDNLEPQSAAFSATLASLSQSLERCRELIQQLALFSPNEEVEDIATQDLQYLTVDFTLAEVKARSYGNGVDRRESLQQSSRLLESFLTRLDHYGLLNASDRTLYERYLEQRNSFRVISTTNPEEKRKIKINRFQEEKALKQKLDVIQWHWLYKTIVLMNHSI